MSFLSGFVVGMKQGGICFGGGGLATLRLFRFAQTGYGLLFCCLFWRCFSLDLEGLSPGLLALWLQTQWPLLF